MDSTMDEILDEPNLRHTPGGWLAVTKPGDSPRIGVMGTTEEEAVANFRASREAWRALRALPIPPVAEHDQ